MLESEDAVWGWDIDDRTPSMMAKHIVAMLAETESTLHDQQSLPMNCIVPTLIDLAFPSALGFNSQLKNSMHTWKRGKLLHPCMLVRCGLSRCIMQCHASSFYQ